MILVGQYDSSFVRRVAIALRIYGIPFEHRPWSVVGDARALQDLNPLMRVPALVIEDGDVIVDSHAIIDYIDGLVAPDMRLLPQREPDRHRAMKIVALATGLADKGVSLFYEKAFHTEHSAAFVARCHAQIQATLRALEDSRVQITSPFWFGEKPGHADIAFACALRHVGDAHPGLIDAAAFPQLTAHAARLEALPVFGEVSQPFKAPA